MPIHQPDQHTGACRIATLPSLADYEIYRTKLAAYPLGKENYAFAKAERFITREDRISVKCVSTPHAKRSRQ